jgi:hypothetical protein
MHQEKPVIEGIARQLHMYITAIQQLVLLLDKENRLLLFDGSALDILRNQPHQEVKHALFSRVETLARIVTRTLQHGSPDDIETIKNTLLPLDSFRRSLRLNSALLEACMERQERRLQRIMEMIERERGEAPCR